MTQFAAVTDRPTILRIMAIKRHRDLIVTIVTRVSVISGLAYVIAMRYFGKGTALPMLVLLLVVIAGFAYSYYNSRCPACGTPIAGALRHARYCWGCGTQLMPDEKLLKSAAPPADQGQR